MSFWFRTGLFVFSLNLFGWFPQGLQAETLIISHPDDSSKTVEAFFKKPPKPKQNGSWPTVVFLHGYQSQPSAGGKDFMAWGVLDKFADRGYLAVSVSQPGFGNSSGPKDFCGPSTQRAVLSVIAKLSADGYVSPNRIAIVGISRGALVAGLIAALGKLQLAGVVLVSGLYDLPEFIENQNSVEAKQIINVMMSETEGTEGALRARSVLNSVRNIKTPVLIMNGEKDNRTDAAQALRLAKEIVSLGGEAKAIIYPDYGHQIPVEVRDKQIDIFIDRVLGK